MRRMGICIGPVPTWYSIVIRTSIEALPGPDITGHAPIGVPSSVVLRPACRYKRLKVKNKAELVWADAELLRIHGSSECDLAQIVSADGGTRRQFRSAQGGQQERRQ